MRPSGCGRAPRKRTTQFCTTCRHMRTILQKQRCKSSAGLHHRFEESNRGRDLLAGLAGVAHSRNNSRVARTDLVEWANEILRPQGLHVSSIAELEAIGNVGAWEESEFHKSAAAAYLAARDELVFLDAMERGALRVPESIKSVISAGIDRAAREEMISSYEKKRAAHESMGEAAKSATAALASHRQATELARVLSESRTADPIPIILSFAGDGPEQGFDIRVPKGLEDGVLTDFLRRAVKTAAAAAGVAVTGEIQESTHLSFHCIPPDASATRMDVLRMQGDCREHLARLVIEASLGDAGPKFRVIDVRDFVI